MSKLIELARINLFDIATQYQAVFTSPSITSSASSSSQDSSLTTPDVSNMRILPSWLTYKMEIILNYISKDLKDAITSDPQAPVESVKDSILYFGQSMSRIGMELRPRLINILNSILKEKYSKDPNFTESNVTSSSSSSTIFLESISNVTTNGGNYNDQSESKQTSSLDSSISNMNDQEKQSVIVQEEIPSKVQVGESEMTPESSSITPQNEIAIPEKTDEGIDDTNSIVSNEADTSYGTQVNQLHSSTTSEAPLSIGLPSEGETLTLPSQQVTQSNDDIDE